MFVNCRFISLPQIRQKELMNKIFTLRQSTLKAENVCYNIKVRGGESAQWASGDKTNKHNSDVDEGFINY